MSVRLRDVMFFAGGRCLQRFGTPVWRMSRDHDVAETFTRASTAMARALDGVYRSVASGKPRVEFVDLDGDGVLDTPALLLEAAGENLLTYSQAFDNAAWTKVESTVTADATTAPDGTTTADKLVENSAVTIAHYVRRPSVSIVSGTSYTVLVAAKAAERSRVRIVSYDGTSDHTSIFNLSTGAVDSGTGSIAALGDGWYLCWQTFTATATTSTNFAVQFHLDNGTTNAYTGDGTSGVYLWGAQLEAAGYASSYIPTTAATATRAADVLTAPFYAPPQEMTVYLKQVTNVPVASASVGVGWVDVGVGQPGLQIDAHATTSSGRAVLTQSGGDVQSDAAALTDYANGDVVEVCATMSATGAVTYHQRINGGTVESDDASSAPASFPSAWANSLVRFEGPQKLVSAVIARGTHSLDDMAGLFG